MSKYWTIALAWPLLMVGNAGADVPPGPSPRPYTPPPPLPLWLRTAEPVKPRLAVTRDPQATSARIILPAEPKPALNPPARASVVLALVLTGALCCIRFQAARKHVLAAAVVLLLAVAGWMAPSASADIPLPPTLDPRPFVRELEASRLAGERRSIGTCKTQISRTTDSAIVQIILPKRLNK